MRLSACAFLLFFSSLSTSALARDCRPLDVPQTVSEKKLILLGELHGTKESPAFAGELVCWLSGAGKKVTLALEISSDMQRQLLLALQQTSAAAASREFDLLDLWDNKFKDGKSSEAYKQLLMRIWEMRRANEHVGLIAIDARVGVSGNEREEYMASRLMTFFGQFPEHQVVALVGNLHAQKLVGTPWNKGFKPLSQFLVGIDVLNLNMDYDAGTAWNCGRTGCGVNQVSQAPRSGKYTTPKIVLTDSDPNFDGVYSLGDIFASLPFQKKAHK